MCSGPAALTIQGIGGALGAYGALKEGKAQDRYYQYSADEEERSAARIIERSGQDVGLIQNKAKEDTKIAKDEASKIFGTQRAAFAASGVSGVTAEDIVKDSFDQAKLDELAIRYNADLDSWVTREDAKNRAYELKVSAAGKRAAGKNARKAGKLNAITSILGSSSQIASSAGGLKASRPTSRVT